MRAQIGVTSLVEIAVVILHFVAEHVVTWAFRLVDITALQAPFAFMPSQRERGEPVGIEATGPLLPCSLLVIIRDYVLITQAGIGLKAAKRELIFGKSGCISLFDLGRSALHNALIVAVFAL